MEYIIPGLYTIKVKDRRQSPDDYIGKLFITVTRPTIDDGIFYPDIKFMRGNNEFCVCPIPGTFFNTEFHDAYINGLEAAYQFIQNANELYMSIYNQTYESEHDCLDLE